MSYFKSIMLAGAVAVSGMFTASNADAAPFFVSGDFEIEIFNFQANGADSTARSAQSFATEANIANVAANAKPLTLQTQKINYVGLLNFNLTGNTQTIQAFFDTATKTSMDALNFGASTLSAGNYLTTTLFRITANSFSNIGSLADLEGIRHDDGVTLTGATGTYSSPQPQVATPGFIALPNFTGNASDFTLIYAAANGNPSVLQVNAIPLPAAAWLLLGVAGALVAAKRRSALRAA